MDWIEPFMRNQVVTLSRKYLKAIRAVSLLKLNLSHSALRSLRSFVIFDITPVLPRVQLGQLKEKLEGNDDATCYSLLRSYKKIMKVI